jgi:hypothetical protein
MAVAFSERRQIRDSFTVRFERRTKPDGDSEQVRKVKNLVFHYDIDVASSVGSEFDAHIDNPWQTNPRLWCVRPANDDRFEVTYTGEWQVEEIQVDDGGRRCVKVTESLVQYGQWLDVES